MNANSPLVHIEIAVARVERGGSILIGAAPGALLGIEAKRHQHDTAEGKREAPLQHIQILLPSRRYAAEE